MKERFFCMGIARGLFFEHAANALPRASRLMILQISRIFLGSCAARIRVFETAYPGGESDDVILCNEPAP